MFTWTHECASDSYKNDRVALLSPMCAITTHMDAGRMRRHGCVCGVRLVCSHCVTPPRCAGRECSEFTWRRTPRHPLAPCSACQHRRDVLPSVHTEGDISVLQAHSPCLCVDTPRKKLHVDLAYRTPSPASTTRTTSPGVGTRRAENRVPSGARKRLQRHANAVLDSD